MLATTFMAFLAGTVVYLVLVMVAARLYLGVKLRALPTDNKNDRQEPISILKPLTGLEPELEYNLRSFFEQDYTNFEILFAVRDQDDPAVPVVEALRKEYTHVPARLVVTGTSRFPNAKVYSLDRMLAEAEHDLVVMSDSDIRVTPDLLRTVAAEFRDPNIGVATCPYRAVAGTPMGGSLWSRLEATGMNVNFISGILAARMIEGMQFAVGPTIVARRSALESFGGFERLKDYLAEDFVMGKFASQAGYGVILSSYVVEHHIGSSGFLKNARHRLRWARSTRRSRPWGYFGQALTMPIPWALAVCAANPAWWPVLPATLAIRWAAAYFVSARVLRARINWALMPLEDLASFAFWLAGCFGSTIEWRGKRYRLFSDGRFELLPETVSATTTTPLITED